MTVDLDCNEGKWARGTVNRIGIRMVAAFTIDKLLGVLFSWPLLIGRAVLPSSSLPSFLKQV
ncbi:MAG: hypothetical protein QXN15_02670 [Candidatus Jordarchaeales archaeon]|nr:hypothetical protein [Candidatus Jordarchaeia archaeon]